VSEYEVTCLLCGMVLEVRHGVGWSTSRPIACQANAGGPHVAPEPPARFRASTPWRARAAWREAMAEQVEAP